MPFAFTEYGILHLANVLHSDIARKESIRIIEVFVRMWKMINFHQGILKKVDMLKAKYNDHDEQLLLIFEYLNQMEKERDIELDCQSRRKIGFRPSSQEHDV